MRAHSRTVCTAILAVVAASAVAQTPIIYPAKGQNTEQQQKDTAECATWAKQNTGIDPAALFAGNTLLRGGQDIEKAMGRENLVIR